MNNRQQAVLFLLIVAASLIGFMIYVNQPDTAIVPTHVTVEVR